MKQFLITTAAGKRLIAKGLTKHPAIVKVIKSGTLAIIAGTTNGYVAEEILTNLGQVKEFSRKNFFRRIMLPPGRSIEDTGRIKSENEFPGDVIIVDGVWQKGLTIFDVENDLNEGDVVLKGVNALDLPRKQAGILIGDPNGGTIVAALQAVVGRRVRLILPVGIEKRISGDLNDLALKLNVPDAHGPRLLPVPGEIFTELESILLLTSTKAELIAGGGVAGAEGSIRLAICGQDDQILSAEKLLRSISLEDPFEIDF